MNRRTFLQLLGFLSIAPVLDWQTTNAEPYDSSGGQWVFDGVGGLTFPATVTRRATSNAARVQGFHALTFLERLLGGIR